MKKILTIFSAAVLGLALISGCGSTGAAGSGAGTIKIGGDLELSGGTAAFGQYADKAIKLAVKQQNAKGGLLGKQIEYVAADNKSEASESTAAATKLVSSDKVIAILGPMTSTDTFAASQVATDNKVPLITPTGTNDKVTIDNNTLKPWIFRACFIDPFQGQVAANFAQDTLKAKTAALYIDQKSDYAKGLADNFKKNFKGQIVAEEQYVAGDKDFKAVLTNIRGKNPDVVFVPGYYQEVGLIVKQARDLGMKQPFLGGDGWASPEIVPIAGAENLNNTFFVNHVAADDPALATFLKDYKAEYNSDPDAFAALGYDAANMLFTAIQTAGSTDAEKIRGALENLKDFKGVSGTMTVDPKTHNPVKGAAIIEYKGGKQVFKAKVEPK